MVVHGQAERHADQENGHEGDQRPRGVHEPAESLLPEQHCSTKGRANREQEAQARNERHHDGSENQEQQEDGQAHHHGQVQRHGVGEALRHIALDWREPGNADVHAGGVFDFGFLSTQGTHEFRGRLIRRTRVRGEHQLCGCDFLVGGNQLGVFHIHVAVETLRHVNKRRCCCCGFAVKGFVVTLRFGFLGFDQRCQYLRIRVDIVAVHNDQEGCVDAGTEGIFEQIGGFTLGRI